MNLTTAMMDALVARKQLEREAADPRLNVHFIGEDGTHDVFSFATVERADRFRDSLRRQGRTVLDGETMDQFWSADKSRERG